MSYTYKVEVRKMDGSDTRFTEFATYKEALDCYINKCDDKNIDESHIEWPAKDTEVDLDAGGIGYTYRVSLLVEEDN